MMMAFRLSCALHPELDNLQVQHACRVRDGSPRRVGDRRAFVEKATGLWSLSVTIP
jgi:hypothetical protein